MNTAHERNLRIAATAFNIVNGADLDDRYGAYAQHYSVSHRVAYCGRIDIVWTQDRQLDVWYRGWSSRRSMRAAAFVLDSNGTVSVVSVDRRRIHEWLPLLNERSRAKQAAAQRVGGSQ